MYRSPYKYIARCTCIFKKKGSWAAGYHTGEDWVCDRDKTLVSPCNGTILTNGYDNSYGYNVIIGTDDNKVIRMCHLAGKSTAQSRIKAGEVIGIMGNTGNSYGAHLHIEIQNSKVWGYAKNLLKPSDYINFNDFGQANPVEPEEGEEEKVIYKTIKDVPQYGKATIDKLIAKEFLQGTDKGVLNISDDMLRILVINDRAGLYS